MSRSRDLANLADEATGGITKAEVGLGNVDNTADSAKPVSTAQQTEIDKLAYQGEPHIIPDVLYPSYVASGTSNKLLDGTTSHSGAFGTAQADGRKYYYTNIAGSKPIKDPRIGGHFGSQRHKFKSLQKLEQETATHGDDVFSIDGREWCRAVGKSDAVVIKNDDDGHYIQTQSTAGTIEITGYFNAVNLLAATWMTSTNTVLVAINGVTAHSAFALNGSATTPLGNRYVDQSSVYNIDITSSSSLSADTSLGINTIKIKHVTGDSKLHGIELIAQDTSNRSNIQIPSQDVVSYGKKFTVSGTPHYDPFSAKTDGSAWTSPTSGTNNANSSASWPTNIDTATSLGLGNWVDGSNYYRPYNGGRVVKWVDSSGTIKTSVTVMPPLAKSIADSNNLTPSAISDSIDASSANSEYRPYFGQDDAYDASGKEAHGGLHELAKSYFLREFGNGSANAGSGAGSYRDASMLNTSDDIAYVMDDGLTSISSKANRYSGFTEGLHRNTSSSKFYHTFIGTGIGRHASPTSGVRDTWAQNLPYGTHILSMVMDGTDTSDWYLDGVSIYANSGGSSVYHNIGEQLHIYQPKRPPIPEDACVIADYMLMADFVGFPNNTAGLAKIIGKGVRRVNGTRDVFYPNGGTFQQDFQADTVGGFRILSNSSSFDFNLPYFGTNPTFIGGSYTDRSTANQFKVNDTLVTTSSSGTNHSGTQVLTSWTSGSNGFSADNDGSFTLVNSSLAPAWATVTGINLGVNKVSINNGSSDYLIFNAFDIVTPIHTSSHYQSFETPFLHELIGGDRNMEQTNLICTPDGRTWDEVTRDTSYLGSTRVRCDIDGEVTTASTVLIFDEWRGGIGGQYNVDLGGFIQKDFAIAYDRVICLVAGEYRIEYETVTQSGQSAHSDIILLVNGISRARGTAKNADNYNTGATVQMPLAKGDYVQIQGIAYASPRQWFYITRLR